MEGQVQLRRENYEHEHEHDHEHERVIEMKDLPLESSPHLKCTDLENYKMMLGYTTAAAVAQGQLSHQEDGAASTGDGGGSHISQIEADAIERKMK